MSNAKRTLADHICDTVQSFRGRRPKPSASFSSIGVDSLGAVMFLRYLSDSLGGIRLSPNSLYGPGITIASFAVEVHNRLVREKPEVLVDLGLVAVPWLGSGPMLLAVLLVAGAGALGLFPIYYSFTQDISRHHQGLVTGVASFFAWVASASFQPLFGRHADQTESFSIGLAAAGAVTLLALAAWAILWPPDRAEASAADGEPTT